METNGKAAKGQEQAFLFEPEKEWQAHWQGMPEFIQEDLEPWKTVYVHFECREDMEEFSKLVGQKVGFNTRSIWFPEAEIGRYANKRYVDES